MAEYQTIWIKVLYLNKCTLFVQVLMQLLLSLAHSLLHLILVSWSVRLSVHGSVCWSHFTFLAFLSNLKVRKLDQPSDWPTQWLVLLRVARLTAISLVFYQIHSFENAVGVDMPRCFSVSGANTKPDLIDNYVLWASWESFCLEMENSGTFTFDHTFCVKNMIR